MNENPVHVKLEYEEEIDLKKNILSSERDLLEIIKVIKEYKRLRVDELRIKDSSYKKIAEILKEIRKLERLLPKIEIEKKKKESKKESKKEEKDEEDIELQLKEIKEKLRAIGGE